MQRTLHGGTFMFIYQFVEKFASFSSHVPVDAKPYDPSVGAGMTARKPMFHMRQLIARKNTIRLHKADYCGWLYRAVMPARTNVMIAQIEIRTPFSGL